MATGDQSDVLARINANLPPWFGDQLTPILTGVLAAYSWLGSYMYGEFSYVKLQTRVTTATGDNLDLIADDFFGIHNFARMPNEGDDSYRNRILANLIRERATRQAVVDILTMITGVAPVIFEPMRPGDGGGYSIAGAGYSVAGGWSNPLVPYQCFITVYSISTSAIASVAGWNIPTGAWNTASRASWVNLGNITNALNAAQIYQAINDTKVEGTVCWTRIINP